MSFRVNKYLFFFTIIFLFDLSFFYLIPSSLIHASDVTFILEILFTVYVFSTCREKQYFRYKWLIIFVAVLVLTSSVAAYKSYSQPIWSGILPQRNWVGHMLMYFPLSKLLKSKKIDVKELYISVEKIIAIYLLIILLQFALGDRLIFMNVGYSFRYGSLRLLISCPIILFVFFNKLQKKFDGKKLTFFDWYLLLGSLFVSLFVVKTRMIFIAVILSLILFFLFNKLNGLKMVISIIFVLFLIIFVNSSYGESIINTVWLQNQDAGIEIRNIGREFYLQRTASSLFSFVFGCGYVNTNWNPSVVGSRYSELIYYVDHGIIGLFFYYGIIFVLWAAFIHIKIIKDAVKTRKYGIVFFLICGLVGSLSIFPYCYVGLSFTLSCVFAENEVSNKKLTVLSTA